MKKKILIFATSQLTFESFLLPIINRLKKNYSIILVSNFKSNHNKKYYGIKIFNLNIRRKISILSDIKNLMILSNFIKEEKFDLVFTITPKAGLIGMLSSFVNKVPKRIHIFTGQVWANKIFPFKLLLKSFDKLIFKFSTDILCDGFSQKKFLIQNGMSENITVLENGSICGVNTDKFKPSSVLKNKLRKKFLIKKEEIIFLYTGRISKDKGIENLLKVFKLLKNLNYKVKFFFVGSDETNKFSDDIKGIPDIKYLKHTLNVHQYYKFADVYITSTLREGFGISVAQAMSSGLPIVGPSIYGLNDLLKNNINSLTFKSGSINEILQNCKKLIINKKIRKKLGYNGRKLIIKKFNEKQVINAYYKYFMKKLS